jgi:hypothetical protein
MNGDRTTGEIKGLARGKLTLKTDHMGTIDIEWESVKSLTSSEFFEVELTTGERHFGALRPASDESSIEVVTDQASLVVERPSVVHITPLESSFLERLDISMDIGFSFTEANQDIKWNFNALGSYRSRRYLVTSNLSSLFSGQKNADSTTRNQLALQINRILGRRWFAAALGNLLQSEELGLELRSLAGVGAGRHVIQTNRQILSLLGGAAFSWEEFQGPEPGRSNWEAVAGLRYEWFSFGEQETDLITTAVLFPNLTTLGRIRLELDSKLRRELVGDLTWNVTLFNSFDSEPPSEDARRNDFGVSTSLGWTF